MSPVRVQRRRVKGWRMPAGAVYVGRGSRWGNPWREGEVSGWLIKPGGLIDRAPHEPLTREQAIESFRNSEEWHMQEPYYVAALRNALAGKDLACWCKLTDPCHADVLLELANKDAP